MLSLPRTTIDCLARLADIHIEQALNVGGPGKPASRGEVNAVKSVTLDGFKHIADAWRRILFQLGYYLEMTAIFCHSYPRVDFEITGKRTDQSRELADLMIAIDYVDSNTQIDRRAVLIQAKLLKGKKLKLQPTPSEQEQYLLLSQLPVFKFVETIYNPAFRDLKITPFDDDCHTAAEYGGLDIRMDNSRWLSYRPGEPGTSDVVFTHEISLGSLLAGMLGGYTGCGRKASQHATKLNAGDDWSATVNELLSVTGSKFIEQSSTSKTLRKNQQILGFMEFPFIDGSAIAFSNLTSNAGNGDNGPVRNDEGDELPGGPLSIVQIIIRNSNSEKSPTSVIDG